jgi:uncharacterized protein YecE (DUF72 family)
MDIANSLHIGTSGWSYEHWKGPFYPEKISGDEMLPAYADQFSTVEINATFYRLPSAKTVKHWKQAVPDDFIFAVKASRYITHQKKLNDPKESTKKFFDRLSLLGNKLGPVLFQLPPNWHKDEQRLSTFLDVLPKAYQYVFEFRDPSWFDQTIINQLKQKNASFCIYDLEGNESPMCITANFIYVRLHGPGARYQGSYGDKLLKKWIKRFNQWADNGKQIYCYFNNDYEARAPLNAQLMKQKTSAQTEA